MAGLGQYTFARLTGTLMYKNTLFHINHFCEAQMKFSFFILKTFSRLKKVSYCVALAALVFAFSVPQQASACCPGFVGDFPRQVILDKEKSKLAGGVEVREFKVEETTWYVPIPQGFVDIETYTQETLPSWLDLEAINLRDWGVSMGIKPGVADYPEFSFINFSVRSEIGQDYDFPENSFCSEIKAFLFGENDTFPKDAWEEGINVIENENYYSRLCEYKDGDAGIFVGLTRASGNIDVEERDRVYAEREARAAQREQEREKEIEKALKEAREKAKAEGREVNEKEVRDSIVIIDEEPIAGESFHTSHMAAFVQVFFPVNGVYVEATCQVGPATSPAELKKAYDLISTWKDNFLKVNQ